MYDALVSEVLEVLSFELYLGYVLKSSLDRIPGREVLARVLKTLRISSKLDWMMFSSR